MIDMPRSLLCSASTMKSPPLVLRSTITGERSQNPLPQRPPFERFLLENCEKIVANARSRPFIVRLELRLEGRCPLTHENTVLRVADELLSNAMEHGFHCRQQGDVFVHLVCLSAVGVQVSVSDDGWGFDSGPIVYGNGFHLLSQIGELYFGAPAGPFVAKTAVTVVIPLNHRRPIAGLPLDFAPDLEFRLIAKERRTEP